MDLVPAIAVIPGPQALEHLHGLNRSIDPGSTFDSRGHVLFPTGFNSWTADSEIDFIDGHELRDQCSLYIHEALVYDL